MKVTAIIEKGADGMFSVRSEQKIGNHYFGGFGESVEIAKEDFLESIQEVIEESKEEGIDTPEDIQVSYYVIRHRNARVSSFVALFKGPSDHP